MDTTDLGRIVDCFKSRPDVMAAYLFGSEAERLAHRHSDVDLAVLLAEGLPRSARFAAGLEIGAALEILCRSTVDLVVLNDAPPLLAFHVFKYGQLLWERDKEMRCTFQAQAMSRYYDFKPYLDYQLEQLVRRVAEKGLGHGYQDRDPAGEARRIRQRLAALGKHAAR